MPFVGALAVSTDIINWLPLPEPIEIVLLRIVSFLLFFSDTDYSQASMGVVLLGYWATRDTRSAGRDFNLLRSMLVFKYHPKVIEKFTRQAREEALAQGREEAHAQWKEWYRRSEEARKQGIPFDEPTPAETRHQPPKE